MKKEKLVVITGASSGIGKAAAKAFHAAGYSLLLIARRSKEMEALQISNSLCHSVDITQFHKFQEAVRQAEKRFGPVDCLINNAGALISKEFLEITPEENERMIDVNFKGVVNGTLIVLEGMKERKRGTILNVSSKGDRNPVPVSSVYCATKAAVKNFTESLTKGYGPLGIRFCNLSPAFIKTPIWEGLPEFYPGMNETMITPEEFATLLLWIYEQPQHINIRDLVITPTLSPY